MKHWPLKPFKFELEEDFSPVAEELLRSEISEIITAQQEIEKDGFIPLFSVSGVPPREQHIAS